MSKYVTVFVGFIYEYTFVYLIVFHIHIEYMYIYVNVVIQTMDASAFLSLCSVSTTHHIVL
jgi:hypothetical protein